MRLRSFVAVRALGALALVVAGCPGGSDQPCYGDACGSEQDGGIDGKFDGPNSPDVPNGDDAGDASDDVPPDTAPPGCEPAKDPKDSMPCVADSYGLFVDGTKGLDANDGKKATPLRTIAAAIAKAATATQKRIYVCEGTYAETATLTLDATHDGISVYGGWSCADWSYSGNKPKVSTPSGYVLRVDALTSGTTVEDIELDAAPGAGANPNSIVVFVTGSKNVTFTRVKLVASTGLRGSDGVTGSNYTVVAANDPGIKGNDFNPLNPAQGGGPHMCTLCTNGVNSTGGAGGSGTLAPTDGQVGQPPITGSMAPNDGAGGPKDTGSGCTNGHHGASAAAAADAPGSAKLGTLDSTGWKPEPGTAGTPGGVGQGGGGGGGGALAGGGGAGGGGCGGCGGAGASAPSGGGASIALLIVDSAVAVNGSTLTTSKPGDGGSGKPGQAGQSGGLSGQNSVPGCPGGTGGTGGAGGASGGGAAGSSIGALYKSATVPAIDGATLASITLADAGTAGGGGGASNGGKAGVKAAVQDATKL